MGQAYTFNVENEFHVANLLKTIVDLKRRLDIRKFEVRCTCTCNLDT